MEQKRRSGRPKKAEDEKVKYQLLAVYLSDFKRFVEKVESRGETRVHAFTKMVDNY